MNVDEYRAKLEASVAAAKDSPTLERYRELLEIKEWIELFYKMGGVIAGGAAVCYMLNRPSPDSDIDFFFNNQDAYEKANKIAPSLFNICYYESDKPYDSFDLAISQCMLTANGEIIRSDLCQEAVETKINILIRDNVCDPFGTFRRLNKYSKRFGLRNLSEDIDFIEKRLYVR